MNMKKFTTLITALLLIVSMTAFTGCGSQTEDPGPPPADVINPENSEIHQPKTVQVMAHRMKTMRPQMKVIFWKMLCP